MKLNIRRTAGLLAAAALLGTIPGTVSGAQAQTVRPASGGIRTVGTLRVVIVGIPHTVKRGTTTNITIWYTENSVYRLQPADLDLMLESAKSQSGANIWVNWLNPVSKRWQPSSRVTKWDHIFDFLPDSQVSIAPNHWARIDAKIYVGKHAELGRWDVNDALSYQGLDPRPDGSIGVLHVNSTGYPVTVVR